jgi:ELWxxDGT repeat protein
MKKRTYLLAACFAGSAAVLAATFLPARLPVDVNAVPIPVSPGLLPVCSSAAFADFTGSADERTQSIWRTDGTSAGTRKLADLGTITDPLTVECLTVHGPLTYFQFIGSDGIAELWRSDGTAAGTQRLLRQPDGAAGPIRYSGALTTPFFVASLNNRGNELITTDGTTAGTRVVADIVPGVEGPNIGNGFAVLGGRLYFSIDSQLWRTDGTESGTLRITTLDRIGDPFSIIVNIQSIDGALYLFTSEISGWSMWRSDGSATGTTAFLFGDFSTDGNVGNELLRSSSGALLFIRSQGGGFNARLWRTDGTTAGTVAITTTEPDLSNIFDLRQLADGRFVFLADTVRYGRELWITDGTDVGTRLVVDLAPGTDSPGISLGIAPFGNGFMFTTFGSSGSARAPWFSNGTAAGTYHLADLDTRLNSPTFSTSGITPLGQVAYFWTTPFGLLGERLRSTLWRFDPAARSVSATTTLNALGGIATYGSVNARLLFVPDDPQLGQELWTSDGTAAGTRLLADLAPQTANGDASPGRLTALGDAMLFAATDGVRARGLWRTDGTAAGTTRLSDGAPSEPSSFPAPESARLGNRIVYTGAATPNDNEVWITDGTSAGSTRLTNLSVPDSFFSGGFANAAPGDCGRGFLELNGRVFFGATVNRIGRLYRTDGTTAGTQEVAPFPFFSNRLFFQSSRVCVLQSLSDRVFFAAASETESGEFLWRINAAGGNAERVTSAAGRPIAAPFAMARVGTALLFHSFDGVQQGWWRISSATAAPELLISERTAAIGNRRLLTVAGNFLYFESCDGNGTCTLSRTDGTAAGTVALAPADLSPFAAPSVGVIGDRVVFQGDPDGELWITDGTTAGTRQLRDILPGAPQSNPTQFVDFRGLVYFVVTIESINSTNFELWRTDGTAANTERANALPVQSAEFNTATFPFGMAAAGNRLFLPLQTVVNGQELWNVENLAPTAQADTATTQAGAAVSVDVLANDTDEDGLLNRGSVRVVQAPASGTTQVDNATGAIRYTPASGFSGTATFTYAVTDNQQRESAPGTVTVTVAAPPAPPSGGGGGGGGGSWDWLSLLLMAGGLGIARRRSH